MSIILGRRHRLLHARALLARWNGGEQEIRQVHSRSPLDSQLLHKERATPRTPLREERRGITSTSSRICSRRNARSSSWVFTTGLSATRSSARTCLTSVAMKKYVVRWTNWRTKTTRTTSLQKKFVCTETIGGLVRTQLVPIRLQSGIDLTSSKHCQPCDSSRTKRIKLITKSGEALLHLGGTGKNPGGILLMSITTTMDPTLIEQGNLLKSEWATYSRYDSQN